MMDIGGLQRTTLIDYPGKVACTIFLVGCNFRCLFCYSPELVLPERIRDHPRIPEDSVFDFLNERKGLLEGVCITGGEPTLQSGLIEFIKKIKSLGYSVKLDTNGSSPDVLKEMIDNGLIDYVAMDVKAGREKYRGVIGADIDINKIEKSIETLKEGKIDYEFRTTVVPGIHSKEEILSIAKWLTPAKRYYLQNFRPEKTLNPEFINVKPYPEEWLGDIREEIRSLFDICEIRG